MLEHFQLQLNASVSVDLLTKLTQNTLKLDVIEMAMEKQFAISSIRFTHIHFISLEYINVLNNNSNMTKQAGPLASTKFCKFTLLTNGCVYGFFCFSDCIETRINTRRHYWRCCLKFEWSHHGKRCACNEFEWQTPNYTFNVQSMPYTDRWNWPMCGCNEHWKTIIIYAKTS